METLPGQDPCRGALEGALDINDAGHVLLGAPLAGPMYYFDVIAMNNRGTVLLASEPQPWPHRYIRGFFESAAKDYDIPLADVRGPLIDVNDHDWVVGIFGTDFYVSGAGQMLKVVVPREFKLESIVALLNRGNHRNGDPGGPARIRAEAGAAHTALTPPPGRTRPVDQPGYGAGVNKRNVLVPVTL